MCRSECFRSSASITFTRRRFIRAEELARFCAGCAADKQGEEIVILDLRGISSFTDFFVICTATSEPHLKAISGEVQDRLKKEGVRPSAVDGFPLSQWIVLDYDSVIVHILHSQKRSFYSLEDLWSDAPHLTLQETS